LDTSDQEPVGAAVCFPPVEQQENVMQEVSGADGTTRIGTVIGTVVALGVIGLMAYEVFIAIEHMLGA
jgi:hypothetical protein